MVLTLQSLPEGCLLQALSFLCLQDIHRCQCANRNTFFLISTHNELWNDILQRICCKSAASSSSSEPLAVRNVQHAQCVLHKLLAATRSRQFVQLNLDVVEVSSMDRSVENPRNTLSRSLCMQQIAPLRKQHVNSSSLSFLQQLGYLVQRHRCHCIGSDQSCYWSSAPNAAPDLVEFITYESRSGVCIVQGFTLTVYQAFFHPNAPVYGPMEAALQILSPTHPQDFIAFPRADPTVVEDAQSYRNTRTQVDEHVTYQSPFFECAHSADTQVFSLPSPVLCVGGKMRLVLRGARERQNLSQWGVAAHADDFYICLSSAEIFGVSLKHYTAERTMEGWELRGFCNDPQQLEESEFVELPAEFQSPQSWFSSGKS